MFFCLLGNKDLISHLIFITYVYNGKLLSIAKMSKSALYMKRSEQSELNLFVSIVYVCYIGKIKRNIIYELKPLQMKVQNLILMGAYTNFTEVY